MNRTQQYTWRAAPRLASIAPSVITSIAEAARKMMSEGIDLCSLSVGEPDFRTDPNVMAAAKAAMDRGETTYPRTQGAFALVDAIIRRFHADYGQSISGGQVLVANGAKQILFNAFQATLQDGDEVIVPMPYWTSYPDIVAMCGGRTILSPALQDGSQQPDLDALEAAITPRTRWVLLNSPSNPSGMLMSDETMNGVFDILRRHPQLMLMCDEIYDKIVYDNLPFRTARMLAPELEDRILIVNGVSKTYAMTGWRIGYGIGPTNLISAMTLVQGQSTSGACSISQAAAAEALSGPQDAVAERCKAYQRRRDLLVAKLNSKCGITLDAPQGAFYALPDITAHLGKRHPTAGKIQDDVVFCKTLLETNRLALVPGSAFGAPGHVRLSTAASEEVLDDGVQRLAAFLSECR